MKCNLHNMRMAFLPNRYRFMEFFKRNNNKGEVKSNVEQISFLDSSSPLVPPLLFVSQKIWKAQLMFLMRQHLNL